VWTSHLPEHSGTHSILAPTIAGPGTLFALMARKIEHTAPRLKRQLRALADPEFKSSQQRFFKEAVRGLGVRTPAVRKLASEAAKEYRTARFSFDEILAISEGLWRSGIIEERALALIVISKFQRQLTRSHWTRFDRWVDDLTNWAETDGLSCEILAPLLRKEPRLVGHLPSWTRSPNRWRRRAAAVSLVRLVRRGEQHDAAFDICGRLADDRDDMVAKGIGWLLKEISRTKPQMVADFLTADIARFSRTTVRYACEKLPEPLRSQVMSA
jgi:3-methyladenine DNA glycosylase AlkD